MGSGAAFKEGRFDEYVQSGDSICGIKVLKKKQGSQTLPSHSHTANTVYARRNQQGTIVQVAFYENHNLVKQIDWSHRHENINNGKIFAKGDIHVHEYKNGEKLVDAREPSKEEWEIYYNLRDK